MVVVVQVKHINRNCLVSAFGHTYGNCMKLADFKIE